MENTQEKNQEASRQNSPERQNQQDLKNVSPRENTGEQKNLGGSGESLKSDQKGFEKSDDKNIRQ